MSYRVIHRHGIQTFFKIIELKLIDLTLVKKQTLNLLRWTYNQFEQLGSQKVKADTYAIGIAVQMDVDIKETLLGDSSEDTIPDNESDKLK